MEKSKLFLGTLAACWTMTFASVASGQEFKRQAWINPGLLSYHFDRNKDYKETNLGLGGEYVFAPDHAAMLGVFSNSEGHRSKYAGYQWRPMHWQTHGLQVSAGAGISLIDGYPTMNNKGWFVAFMPIVAIEGEKFGANLVLIPNVKHGGAIAVQFKMKVW
jgi:hypothetical protein